MTDGTRDTRAARLIRTMRFPLIVLVLIGHSVGYDPSPMTWPADGPMVYHFFSEMISHHLAPCSVNAFFVFSGLLFFRDYPASGVWPWITAKWKKRSRSLLVPYLLWNGLAVLAMLLVTKAFAQAGVAINDDGAAVLSRGPLYWFLTGPADYPLWYMRDLIIMMLLVPLLAVLIRRAPWTTLLLLTLCYLPLFPIPFLSPRALFFFGVGAWISMRQVDWVALCRRVKVPAAILAVVLMVAATALHGRPGHEWLLNLFYPFGMISLANLCDAWMEHPRFEKRMAALDETVFFVYAVHEIYILGWTKGLFLRLLGDSLVAVWTTYLLVPVVVLLICLLLYRLFQKLTPAALAFACGGRSAPRQK